MIKNNEFIKQTKNKSEEKSIQEKTGKKKVKATDQYSTDYLRVIKRTTNKRVGIMISEDKRVTKCIPVNKDEILQDIIDLVREGSEIIILMDCKDWKYTGNTGPECIAGYWL